MGVCECMIRYPTTFDTKPNGINNNQVTFCATLTGITEHIWQKNSDNGC